MKRIVKTMKLCLALIVIMTTCTAAFGGQTGTIDRRVRSLEEIQGRFTFAVIGDSRSGDDVYQKILGMIMERRPAFVVNVGDVVSRPGNMPAWKRFRELSAPVTVPYFLAAGNHDVGDTESEKMYREETDMPGNGLFYSFSAGNSLFVVLDSDLAGQERRITGAQLEWLESLLEASPKRHTFVFLHHPLHVDRLVFSGTLGGFQKERDRLWELLVRHKVDAVFAGHLHFYQRGSFRGLTQIITGGAGAALIADEDHGGFYHFILITVDGDAVNGEVIDLEGRVRDRFSLSR